MRQFYLHTRKGGIIYVQFVDQATRKCLPALSTRKTNRDEALIVVYDWLKNGIPKKELSKPRPVTEEVTVNHVLDALRKIPLTSQDVSKIEAILKEQGLILAIVQKNSFGSQLFIEFLDKFWDYDKSPYVEEKLSHKKKITRGYVSLSHSRVGSYWKPYFDGCFLEGITRKNLKDFAVHIAKENGHLSSHTLKHILRVGVYALKWAYTNEYISNDPTVGILGEYSSSKKKRGVLSPNEASELFSLSWKDNLCFFVNILAMTTGMRIGEILALKAENIGEKYITVKQSYSRTDGIKGTKTDTERTAPILPEIRDGLLKIASENPYGKDGFIFYGIRPDEPMNARRPLYALQHMLITMRIGDRMAEFKIRPGDGEEEIVRKKEAREEAIDEAKRYWKQRNVVFHSWRHFYAARMTDRIEARKVMLATGHTTEAVFKTYSDHVLEGDLAEVAEMTGEVFGTILPESIVRE